MASDLNAIYRTMQIKADLEKEQITLIFIQYNL